jgi:hypothetical protein
MTEAEWLACADPQAMLAHLEGNASERTLRLLCSACFRRAWQFLETDALRQAVDTLERFADGETDEATFQAARSTTHPLMNYRDEMFSRQVRANVLWVAYAVNAAMWVLPEYGCRKSLGMLAEAAGLNRDVERAAHAELIREVFGNPFHLAAVSPTQRTPTVLQIAQAAYENPTLPDGRLDASRLAVLADALEDAGCDNHTILDHCRGPGPHVRGCWVIDLLLGKE